MDFWEVVAKRQSVRAFLDREIPQEDIRHEPRQFRFLQAVAWLR